MHHSLSDKRRVLLDKTQLASWKLEVCRRLANNLPGGASQQPETICYVVGAAGFSAKSDDGDDDDDDDDDDVISADTPNNSS